MKNLLNVTAHMLGQASGSDDMRHNLSCTKRARQDRNIFSSGPKGVVALLSGNWAAHVYLNHNWICIGIFKTENEAVRAYESSTAKILVDCLNINLQKRSNTAQELNILKQKFTRTQLFEKVLTPSDVGKLYRIVIPKMYANCFSSISDGNKSSSEVLPFNDEIAFYDRSMTLWKFRYCYWKASKSYVFSSGWINFVRANKLNSKDKVIFFKCEHVETAVVHTYFAIDVEYYADRGGVEEASSNSGKYVTNGEQFHLKEGVQNIDDEQNDCGTACTRHKRNIEVDNDLERTGSGKAPQTSFKLFGVKIA